MQPPSVYPSGLVCGLHSALPPVGPIPSSNGVLRCAPYAVYESRRQGRKNVASRRRYTEQRANGLCTDCGPSLQVAALPPTYTVIELATAEDRGCYDSEAKASMFLTSTKLSRDEIEVIADQPVLASIATPE